MPDVTIDCIDCHMPFVFSDAEAQFYAEKQLNTPKRCQSCRTKRRRERTGGNAPEFHDVTCSQCNKPCKVPFVPREGRPVFCLDCFKAQQNANA